VIDQEYKKTVPIKDFFNIRFLKCANFADRLLRLIIAPRRGLD
jgi:hypothetical protein